MLDSDNNQTKQKLVLKNSILRRLTSLSIFALTVMAFSNPASAQMPLSPRGSVSQTLDGTTIDIDYSRPALKGREGLFGGQIFWGHIWTPGADWATTIEVDSDFKISGVDVPAGKYSLWMIVVKGDWEVALSPDWRQFHWPEPEREDDWITFWVTPDTTAEKVETLTFDFPEHDMVKTTLRLRWDHIQVDLPIEVPYKLQMSVTEEEVASYIGTFETEVLAHEFTPEPYSFEMDFSYENDEFHASIQWTPDGQKWPMDLLPRVDQIFYFADIDDGEVKSTSAIMVEFLKDEFGIPQSFEIRTDEDDLWMRGTRKSDSAGNTED